MENFQEYTLRNIQEQDCTLLKKMARDCGTLDVHTAYTYWVVSRFFADTSFVLCRGSEPVGYIMAIEVPEGVFIWQIGILKEYRGKGISALLISPVFEAARRKGANILLSIDEENAASNAAFRAFCQRQGLKMETCGDVKLRDAYDPTFSECEKLYCIHIE